MNLHDKINAATEEYLARLGQLADGKVAGVISLVFARPDTDEPGSPNGLASALGSAKMITKAFEGLKQVMPSILDIPEHGPAKVRPFGHVVRDAPRDPGTN